ncbi:MAG: hypothetical protein AABX70_01005 [Nanoarchaeota archaeon]
MVNVDYLLGFILRGRTRKKVFLEISQHVRVTPAVLYIKTNIDRSHIRRSLLELLKTDLVRCTTPKAQTGKVYVLTDNGRKVKKLLEQM